jgi:hypothetical protein
MHTLTIFLASLVFLRVDFGGRCSIAGEINLGYMNQNGQRVPPMTVLIGVTVPPTNVTSHMM